MTKLTIQQAMRVALDHHQAGRLDRAEHMYRQVLAHDPRYPDALHLLGVLASQSNQHDMAIALLERAIAVDPSKAEFHNNLGEALRRSGDVHRALECFRKAISLKSDYADAHNNLGAALEAVNQPKEAMLSWKRAAELDPENPQPFYNAGLVQMKHGDPADAILMLRKAIERRPNYADAHAKLGDALRLADRSDEAVAAYQRSVNLSGGSADTFQALADALVRSGKIDEAIETLAKIRDLKPASANVRNNLALLLERRGRFAEALNEYQQAVKLGNSPEAHNNLGNYFGLQSNLDRSIEEFRKALALDESFYEAHSNLANALVETAQVDEALTEYRKALQLKQNFPAAHSNMLLAMLYHPGFSPQELFQEHRRWDELYGAPLRDESPHENDRDPDRKLRIGYISPDFRAHAVAFFSLPVLAAHDREKFQIFCYSNTVSTDLITQRFQKHANSWHDIAGLPDSRIAELIRSHGIDILIDLAGHTGNNRMLVSAMKPAPVQVSAWGYPHTTGLSAIDYRITDSHCDPAGMTEELNSEHLIRMPETLWCYQPPDPCPDVSPLPCTKAGRVTFSSFNNLAKVNLNVIELWARILRLIPKSRLIMKANGLGSELARKHIESAFAGHGIGSDQLLLMGRGGFREYLGLFSEVDIALDSFPFNGGTTTCHGLWMGVPVVTLAGRHHTSRMGVSLLSNVGLGDLIAQDEHRYVRIVVELANDQNRLSELRRTMRQRLNSSPLLDGPRLARALESAYREMWQRWCSSPQS
jgi:protein O-GlcNAc transferase